MKWGIVWARAVRFLQMASYTAAIQTSLFWPDEYALPAGNEATPPRTRAIPGG